MYLSISIYPSIHLYLYLYLFCYILSIYLYINYDPVQVVRVLMHCCGAEVSFNDFYAIYVSMCLSIYYIYLSID